MKVEKRYPFPCFAQITGNSLTIAALIAKFAVTRDIFDANCLLCPVCLRFLRDSLDEKGNP